MSQVSNRDGVVLEIYLDHKFQLPLESLNSESLVYKVVTLWPKGLGNYLVCKRFAVQSLLWSLEFVTQINLENRTIVTFILVLLFTYKFHAKNHYDFFNMIRSIVLL